MSIKVLTFKVRGLGSCLKWNAIMKLIAKEEPNLIFLQETKLQSVDDKIYGAMWGDAFEEWRQVPAVGALGGIQCFWELGSLQVIDWMGGKKFLYIQGRWCGGSEVINIVNAYSPGSINEMILWEELVKLKKRVRSGMSCVLGDFNVIRKNEEGKGRCESQLWSREIQNSIVLSII